MQQISSLWIRSHGFAIATDQKLRQCRPALATHEQFHDSTSKTPAAPPLLIQSGKV